MPWAPATRRRRALKGAAELQARWTTLSGADVFDELIRTGSLATAPFPPHQGRVDLRGIPLPQEHSAFKATWVGPDLECIDLSFLQIPDIQHQYRGLRTLNVLFRNCRMDGIDGGHRVTGRFHSCSLRDLHADDLAARELIDCDLTGVRITHDGSRGGLQNAKGCLLQNASLRRLFATGQQFEDCDFRHADFRWAAIGGARFVRCNFEGAAFADAFFSRTRFESCTGLEVERMVAEALARGGTQADVIVC